MADESILHTDDDFFNWDLNATQAKDDPVNHPAHYTTGNIETIDFIQDKELNFARGNAVKYVVRAGLKDKKKEIEDLEKAIFYIKAEIKDILRKQGAVQK